MPLYKDLLKNKLNNNISKGVEFLMSATEDQQVYFISKDGAHNPALFAGLSDSETGQVVDMDIEIATIFDDVAVRAHEKGWAVYTHINKAFEIDRILNPISREPVKVPDYMMRDFYRVSVNAPVTLNVPGVRMAFGYASIDMPRADNYNPAPEMALAA